MNSPIDLQLLVKVLASLVAALVMSFAATPVVKIFAQKVGAIDVPKDGRRMHDHPIPRLGGLAIFLGFLLSTLLFGEIDVKIRGILLGCVVIVTTGVIDDITPLKWWLKLLLQLAAAIITVAAPMEIPVRMILASGPNLRPMNSSQPRQSRLSLMPKEMTSPSLRPAVR